MHAAPLPSFVATMECGPVIGRWLEGTPNLVKGLWSCKEAAACRGSPSCLVKKTGSLSADYECGLPLFPFLTEWGGGGFLALIYRSALAWPWDLGCFGCRGRMCPC